MSLRDTSERHLPPRRGVVRAIGSVLLPNFYTGLEGRLMSDLLSYELRFQALQALAFDIMKFMFILQNEGEYAFVLVYQCPLNWCLPQYVICVFAVSIYQGSVNFVSRDIYQN